MPPLLYACVRDSACSLAVFLEHGEDVSVNTPIEAPGGGDDGEGGATLPLPLYAAAGEGSVGAMLVALGVWADVNLANDDGATALHAACQRRRGNPDAVRVLLWGAADPDAVDGVLGYTPMHFVLEEAAAAAAERLADDDAAEEGEEDEDDGEEEEEGGAPAPAAAAPAAAEAAAAGGAPAPPGAAGAAASRRRSRPVRMHRRALLTLEILLEHGADVDIDSEARSERRHRLRTPLLQRLLMLSPCVMLRVLTCASLLHAHIQRRTASCQSVWLSALASATPWRCSAPTVSSRRHHRSFPPSCIQTSSQIGRAHV